MIMKSLIVVHRYVGVALGVIMTLWCLSGFVMMYQGYPETTREERLAGLERLILPETLPSLPIDPTANASSLRIEMVNGAPVIRIGGGRDGGGAFDLATGQVSSALDEAGVRRLAATHAAGNAISGDIARLDRIDNDQWVVSGARLQPLWRAEFSDPGNTLIYINASNAQVVQDANAGERLVAWLGAIPHWLYPLVLRENQPLWFGVVCWLSAIGCFLVITGIVIGVVRLRGKSGKWWPYKRPMWMLHHIFGTFAGLLVLTWTFSGLLTMQPWGLLESEPTFDRAEVSSSMTWEEARAILDAQRAAPAIANAVSLRGAPFLGQPYLIATARDGSETRIGREGPTPLTETEIAAGLAARGGALAAGKLERLDQEDEFYYGHKREVQFPVWRLSLPDTDQTRIYFNGSTGEPRVVDATAQRYRWWENGLHSLDFSFLRARPLWDIVTLILLSAVTFACATGAWLSFTRIGQDWSRIREALKRK